MAQKKKRPLSDEISELPESVLTRTRKGFASATKMAPDEREKILGLVFDAFTKNTSVINPELAKEYLTVSNVQAGNAVTAFSVLIGLLSDRDDPIESVIIAGSGKLFEAGDSDQVAFVANAIRQRGKSLERNIRRHSLSAETLPSLVSFELSVDLRLGFSEEKLVESVPVAVVHISTDTEPEIWLQLSRGDIDTIITKLQKTSKQMEVAETLLDGRYQRED